MTKRLEIRERSPVNTSVRPSLKYSCSGSLLMFTKGSTTSDGLSGKGSDGGWASDVGDEERGGRDGRDPYHSMLKVATRSTTPAVIHRYGDRTRHDRP